MGRPRGREPGVCLPHRGTAAGDAVRLARRSEELGYASVWVSELATYDAVAVAAAIAAATERIGLGLAIVPVTTRTPALHAMSLSTLGWLLPDRIAVGYGVSTETIVEGWHGQELARPVAEIEDLFAILDQCFEGRPTEYRGARRSSQGFRLDRPAPRPPRRYVGALGPRMRRFTRERADGLILNLAPRARLAEIAAAERAREGFEVALPIRVAVDPEPEARRRFRRELASYLRVPAYAAAFEAQGHGDVVAEVGGLGSLEEMAAALPDELVADVWIAGTAGECRAALERVRDDGVTPLLVPVIGPGDLDGFERAIEALAERPGLPRRGVSYAPHGSKTHTAAGEEEERNHERKADRWRKR